jgi:hypothetical protein
MSTQSESDPQLMIVRHAGYAEAPNRKAVQVVTNDIVADMTRRRWKICQSRWGVIRANDDLTRAYA